MSPQQILTTVMTCIVVDKTIHHAKAHSICFLPQYQRNEIFVLTIENTDSDLEVQMSCLYASDFSFKNFCKLAYINMQKQFEKMLGKKSNDAYSLSIRVHTTKNHISVCFFTTQNQRQRKCFFFRARAEKGIA